MGKAFAVAELSPLRQIIATRTTEAARTIPHFHLCVDLDFDALLKCREALRQEQPDVRVSVNDLLIKACARALMDVPEINIQLIEKEIHQYLSADVAVVIAVKGGLSTPIIRDADAKSIWEITQEMKELASLARRGALRWDQITGGSFSVSNLGMFGIEQFDAIINPPQCAILGIGTAKPRLSLSEQNETKIATIARATLSLDHRALDGVTGARFLSALRDRVLSPHYMLKQRKD